MNIGDRVKLYRTNCKLTQKTLSETLGINVRTLQKYEANEITPPLDMLNKIAAALEVSINDLLGNEEVQVLEIGKAPTKEDIMSDILLYMSDKNKDGFVYPDTAQKQIIWESIENMVNLTQGKLILKNKGEK